MSNYSDVVESAVRDAVIANMPPECKCDRTVVRRRGIRGGSVQYVRQCLDCGEAVGSPVRQDGNDVPAFDESLRQAIRVNRAATIERIKEIERTTWWGHYQEYMASDDWQAVRQKALKRDGMQCQGCLDAPATDVHHRTYEHFGNEFVFELISLCRPCHERMHEK